MAITTSSSIRVKADSRRPHSLSAKLPRSGFGRPPGPRISRWFMNTQVLAISPLPHHLIFFIAWLDLIAANQTNFCRVGILGQAFSRAATSSHLPSAEKGS